MKKIYLHIFCLFLTINHYSQTLRFNDFSRNYYVQKSEMQTYLDSLHSYTPDSIFFHEGSEFSQFKQWENFWEHRLYPDGDFDLYFMRQDLGNDEIRLRSTGYNALWHEIGPLNEPTGEMTGFNGGQSTGIGPIEFIRFYKSDPQKMICGSTRGGLFFSSDGGENWINSGSDNWSGLSVVSWSEFKSDDPEVIYAVSCLGNDNKPGPIQSAGGVFRSIKNGMINPNTQWERIADYVSLGVSINCQIKKILTDPTDSDILYVVTTEGLFKSSNINSITPTWLTLIPFDNIFDLEMKPNDNFTLFASFNSPSSNSNLVKYSNDGGISWSILPNLPVFTSADIMHITIEVSEAFPDNIYLYFFGVATINKNIYRYNYSSFTFLQINGGAFDSGIVCCYGDGTAFGISQSGIDEIILIADNDRYRRYVNGVETVFTNASSNKFEYHVDMEGFTFNPNNSNEVWMASHGGTYKSINSSDPVNNWAAKLNGLGVALVFYMADSYQNPEDILISTYHDGCILTEGTYFDSWTPPWKYVWGGDGQSVLIDHENPNYMYASGVGSTWGASTDGGNTPFGSVAFFTTGGWWGSDAILNKGESKIIYGKRNQEVNRSLDATSFLSQGNIISDLDVVAGVSSACSQVNNLFTFENNSELLMASFLNCTEIDLYYTMKATDPFIDPVADWSKINLGNGGRNIYDIEIDPLNYNNIYVALFPDWSGGSRKMIMKIENFSSPTPNIIDLTSNFPTTNYASSCLVLEKGSDGGIYVSTDLGEIFYTNNKLFSTDPSNAWIQFGDNLPNTTFNALEINYKVNKIRTAAYGRGIWDTDLYCPPDLNYNETAIYSTNLFLEAQNTITSTAEVASGLNVNYRAGDEITMMPGFIANAGSDFRAFIHPCNKAGNSFKSGSNSYIAVEEKNEPSLQLVNNFSFTVYPNPNNGNFTITLKNVENKNITGTLTVYNFMGTIISKQQLVNESTVIDLKENAKGIYYVKIENEFGIKTEKVIYQ